MFNSIEEYNSFTEDYKLSTKKELSGILTIFSYGSTEQLAMRIVSFYNHKIEIGRKHYKEIGMVAFLTINHGAFREFIESIENAELKDCIIGLYNSNLNRRHTIDTEIVLMPIRFSGEGVKVKKPIIQALQNMSQQQAPIPKTVAEELRHYNPTEEQKAQALKDMANARETVELPHQIEMPTLELNRSKSKIVNLFWDKLEGILPK